MLKEKDRVQPAEPQPQPIFAPTQTGPAVSSTIDNSYVAPKSSAKNSKKILKVLVSIFVSLILLGITLFIVFLIYQAVSSEDTMIEADNSGSVSLLYENTAKNSEKTKNEIQDISYYDMSDPDSPDGSLVEDGKDLTILCRTEDDLSYMYDVASNDSDMYKYKA